MIKLQISQLDELTMSKKSTFITFVEEGSEGEVVESERLVNYEDVVPTQLNKAVPHLEHLKLAKVGGTRGKDALHGFLTKMSEGDYVVTVKSSMWKAYSEFIQAVSYVINRFAEKSVITLTAMLERCFFMSQEFLAEEAEVI